MKRAALILGCFLVAACGEPKLDHGTVVSKVHEPAHDYTFFIPLCTSTGGQYPVTTCIPIPYFVHDGEDWKLELHDGDRNGWDYVDEATWERTQIGDRVEKGRTRDPSFSKRRQG